MLVEADELLGAEPRALVGDDAVGEVSASFKNLQPSLDRFALLTSERIELATSALDLLNPLRMIHANSQRATSGIAIRSADLSK
ncbi:MAG: hypothetical protein ABR923_19650 [Terracidiphilus sp.]